jgi:hypothetical protein
MRRIGLWGLVFAFLLAGSVGCGNKPQVKQGTDPFKAKSQTKSQKGTNRANPMIPKEVKTDK